MECENKYCFHYGKIRFYCRCRIADREKSPAFIDECRSRKIFLNDIKDKNE